MITKLALGVSLSLVAALQTETTEWKKFAPPGAGFTVLMPGSASERKEKIKTDAGPVEVTYFVVQGGAASYVVSLSTFPRGVIKNETQEKRLKNARDGAVASARGKLASEKPFKLGPFRATELVIEGEKAFIRTRIYVVQNQLYQTLVIGGKGMVEATDTKKFLDSFRVVVRR